MFKVVKSKPNFSVNKYGDVIWNDTGSVLKPFLDKDGYLRVTYRANGKSYHIAPHRAVAEMFVKNPKPDEYNIVNHLDSNKENPYYKNLQWTNSFGNRQHCQVTGTHNVFGEKHSQCKTEEEKVHKVCKMLSIGMRRKDISEVCDIPSYQISNIKAGKSWRHVSKQYDINIPRKDTISKATYLWIIQQLEDGLSPEQILSCSRRFSESDLDRIRDIMDNWKCND